MPDEGTVPKFTTPKATAAGVDLGKEYEAQNYAATHRDPEELHALAQHPEPDVVKEVAENEHSKPETLKGIYEKFQGHPDFHKIAEKAAQNPNAPQEVVHHAIENHQPSGYGSYNQHLVFHPKADTAVVQKKVGELLDMPEHKMDLSQKKGAVRQFMESEHARPEHVNYFLNHKEPSYAVMALRSKHATPEHHQQVLNRPDLRQQNIEDMVEHDAKRTHPTEATDDPTGETPYLDKPDPKMSPEMINQAVEKDKAGNARDTGISYDLRHSLVEHPNTPPHILSELRSKHHKEDAIEHPNYPMEDIQKIVDERTKPESKDIGYSTARDLHGVLGRKDLPADMVNKIDALVERSRKGGMDKYAKEKVLPRLILHPNYPKEKQLKKLKEDVFAARALLRRKDVSPEQLSSLLQHKTKDVAVEALGHPKITAEHVKEAFDRKAGEVSRAAASHALATPEMKKTKLEADPKALPEYARKESDPAVLDEVFERGKTDPQVVNTLQHNPHVSEDTMHKLLSHLKEQRVNPPAGYDHYKWDVRRDFQNHPAFSERIAERLSELGSPHYLANEKVSPETLRRIAEEDTTPKKQEKLGKMLLNPNINSDFAKQILTGQFGDVGNPGYSDGDNLKIQERPDIFTKDVVHGVLNAPRELVPNWAVNEMAKSPHLSSADIKHHLEETYRNSDEDKYHRGPLVRGLLENPNADSALLHKVATDRDYRNQIAEGTSLHNDMIEGAVAHPNLTNEHVQDIYQHEGEMPRDAMKALTNQIYDRGMKEDALKTGSPEVVQAVAEEAHKGYGAKLRPEDYVTAIQHNTDPEVKKLALKRVADNARMISDDQRKFFDTLAEHPDKEVREAAFPLMTEEKRNEITAGKDPRELTNLIPALSQEQVKNLKINPGDPDEYAKGILRHSGSTKEHALQAIEHSENLAGHVPTQFDHHPEIFDKMMEKYPNNLDLMTRVAKNSSHAHHGQALLKNPTAIADPEIAQKMVRNPEFDLPNNDSIKSLKGHAYGYIFKNLAEHPKTKVGILSHILNERPELAMQIAASPKAKSPILIKKLLLKNDPDVNVELVNNEKVPDEIKNELLKDPKVGLTARPNAIPAETLQSYVEKHDDPEILQKVIQNRNASRPTRDVAALKLLKSGDDNVSKKHALNHIASEPDTVSRPVFEEVAMHSPETASHALAGLDGTETDPTTGHEVPVLKPSLYRPLLEKYGGYSDVQGGFLSNQAATRDPDMVKTVLNKIQPDIEGNISGGLARAAHEALQGLDKRGLLDEGHLDAAFEKFGKGSIVNGQKQLRELVHSFIPAEAGPELQKKILESGDAWKFPGLNANRSLSKESIAKISDKYLNTTPDEGDAHEFFDDMGMFAANPSLDKHTREKLVNKLVGSVIDDYWNDKYGRQLLSSPSLSPKTVEEHIAREVEKAKPKTDEPGDYFHSTNLLRGLYGNPNASEERLKEGVKHLPDFVAMNPKFRLSMLPEGEEFESERNRARETLLENYHAHPEDLKFIAERVAGQSHWFNKLLDHPKLPRDAAKAMIEKAVKDGGYTDIKQSPFIKEALFSPSVGGDIFRENIIPEGVDSTESSYYGHAGFPPSLNLDDSKAIKETHHYPSLKKVRDVSAMVPEGGHLDWAEFKKGNPSLAGDPIIQKMFTSAPKQRLTKEHADQYMKTYPDKKSFGVTYRRWAGMQRHNGQPQLVVQLNSSPEYEQALQEPTTNAVHQLVRRGQYSSSHPVTPATIGWSRVDTSNPNHWFIEEIQSDYTSGLAKQVHNFIKYGGGREFEKYKADPGDVNRAVNKLEGNAAGWNQGLLNAVIELAKKHGVKKLSIHSGKSKTIMNKGADSEVTHKYDKIYNKMPEEYGFKPDQYRNLPSADLTDTNGDNPIWTLALEDEETKKSMPKPEKLSKSVLKARDIIRKLRDGKQA